jgi:hypothetical protein
VQDSKICDTLGCHRFDYLSQVHRNKMSRNKIKQDFNFTILKGFKIIKLTTCDIFYNKKISCTFYDVWLFFSSIYATTTAINTCKKVIWRWSKGGKRKIIYVTNKGEHSIFSQSKQQHSDNNHERWSNKRIN